MSKISDTLYRLIEQGYFNPKPIPDKPSFSIDPSIPIYPHRLPASTGLQIALGVLALSIARPDLIKDITDYSSVERISGEHHRFIVTCPKPPNCGCSSPHYSEVFSGSESSIQTIIIEVKEQDGRRVSEIHPMGSERLAQTYYRTIPQLGQYLIDLSAQLVPHTEHR